MVGCSLETCCLDLPELFRSKLVEIGTREGRQEDDIKRRERGAIKFKRALFGLFGKERKLLRDDFVALLREFGFRYAEIDRSLELIQQYSVKIHPVQIHIDTEWHDDNTMNRYVFFEVENKRTLEGIEQYYVAILKTI